MRCDASKGTPLADVAAWEMRKQRARRPETGGREPLSYDLNVTYAISGIYTRSGRACISRLGPASASHHLLIISDLLSYLSAFRSQIHLSNTNCSLSTSQATGSRRFTEPTSKLFACDLPNISINLLLFCHHSNRAHAHATHLRRIDGAGDACGAAGRPRTCYRSHVTRSSCCSPPDGADDVHSPPCRAGK